MNIRPYLDSDQQAVVALWREVFAYSTPHNDPAKVIEQKLKVQRDLFLVATVGDELAGTAMGGYDGHRGWLYAVAVAPPFRRQGIATALVQRLEQGLAERGCPKANLQVLASNAAVVEFYRKLGYGVEERISMGKVLANEAGDPAGPR